VATLKQVFFCGLTTRAQFGSGDGLLNFYLYNWRSKALAGMNPTEGQPAGRGVGVVML